MEQWDDWGKAAIGAMGRLGQWGAMGQWDAWGNGASGAMTARSLSKLSMTTPTKRLAMKRAPVVIHATQKMRAAQSEAPVEGASLGSEASCRREIRGDIERYKEI